MLGDFLGQTFSALRVPVVVCKNEAGYPLEYSNRSARILLGDDRCPQVGGTLETTLRFSTGQMRDDLLAGLVGSGAVEQFGATIHNFEDNRISVRLDASLARFSNAELIFIYIYAGDDMQDSSWKTLIDNMIATAFHIAYHTENLDEAINKMLAYVGAHLGVSRAYIFENMPEDRMKCTYEWCGKNTEAIISMQPPLCIGQDIFQIMQASNTYIVNDVRLLSKEECVRFAPQQAKSFAIAPLQRFGSIYGFLGFDDCESYRTWSRQEAHLLKSIANITASIITRRNAEAQVKNSLDILQSITDNMDSVVYVRDVKTYELVFINKVLAKSLGKPPEEMLGKLCYAELQEGQREQCPFCPLRRMLDEEGNVLLGSLRWEFCNTRNGKWYLVKDSLIKWIDGRNVHIETATEITSQKQQEEELRYHATVDAMTGVFNRECGMKKLTEMAAGQVRDPISLVFIDLDGLKYVNDSFGHDAGDDMIIDTVDLLRIGVRKSDVLFRYGGDEFVLLLQCEPENARRIMAGVDKRLNAYNETSGKPYTLSISYGIKCLRPDRRETVEQIISEADRRMYESKLAKRG